MQFLLTKKKKVLNEVYDDEDDDDVIVDGWMSKGWNWSEGWAEGITN